MCKYHHTVFSLMRFCYLVLSRNLAMKGIASESSTRKGHKSQWANDGNDDAKDNQHSCSQTLRQKKPWWRVTFDDTIHVYEVEIVNRADCCGK